MLKIGDHTKLLTECGVSALWIIIDRIHVTLGTFWDESNRAVRLQDIIEESGQCQACSKQDACPFVKPDRYDCMIMEVI